MIGRNWSREGKVLCTATAIILFGQMPTEILLRLFPNTTDVFVTKKYSGNRSIALDTGVSADAVC